MVVLSYPSLNCSLFSEIIIQKGEIVGGADLKTGKTKQNMIYLEYRVASPECVTKIYIKLNVK